MKKKWPLFILIPLLIALILLFIIYLLKSPKKIENETIGTYYSFQGIQFNMLSNTLYPMEDVYDELLEEGEDSIIPYTDESENKMFIIKRDSTDFFDESWSHLSNPLKLVFVQAKTIFLSYKEDDPTWFNMKTYYSDTKNIIYTYSIDQDGSEIWLLDILIDNNYYSISLNGKDLEDDVEEIILTVNIKD